MLELSALEQEEGAGYPAEMRKHLDAKKKAPCATGLFSSGWVTLSRISDALSRRFPRALFRAVPRFPAPVL